MRKLLISFVLTCALLVGVSGDAHAQGPYSAQIQRAIAAYGFTSPKVWSGISFTTTGGTDTCIRNAIGNTSTDCVIVQNTTAATAGVPVQQSPRLRFRSQVWNTTAVAANNTNDFFIESTPVSGTTPSGLLKFGSSLNGAGATYPMTLTSGGNLAPLGTIYIQGGQALFFGGGSFTQINSPSDGVLTLQNSAATDFSRLQFGGTTSSFPALKRNGVGIDFRLADDSGYTFVTASGIDLASSNITPGAGTGITVSTIGNVATQVYKVTVASTNFIAAAVTADVTIATLPAKTKLVEIYADLTQTFACASVCTTATLSMTCGSAAGTNDILLTFDMDAATTQRGLADADLGTALTRATAVQGGKIFSWSGTTPVFCRLTSGTGNIGTGAATNLSQGSITYYLTTVRLP